MNDLNTELHALYSDESKHSIYQNIPDFVSAEFGYAEKINESWRGDRPRLSFIKSTRIPAPGESWLDFGANTGFFLLSLAHDFPGTNFIAVEANPNHARFMELVVRHFGMGNVEVIQNAIGLRGLATLPRTDVMLHLNVLHHAGHDFDCDLVRHTEDFTSYAIAYLSALHERTDEMVFQLGNNWGGNTSLPLVGTREDTKKLGLFTSWLRDAGWHPRIVAYPHKQADGSIRYVELPESGWNVPVSGIDPGDVASNLDWRMLDEFPGEFYRRPLFHCSQQKPRDASGLVNSP